MSSVSNSFSLLQFALFSSVTHFFPFSLHLSRLYVVFSSRYLVPVMPSLDYFVLLLTRSSINPLAISFPVHLFLSKVTSIPYSWNTIILLHLINFPFGCHVVVQFYHQSIHQSINFSSKIYTRSLPTNSFLKLPTIKSYSG